MISPEIWKTIAECLQDILIALEKTERIDMNEDVDSYIDKNCDSYGSNTD